MLLCQSIRQVPLFRYFILSSLLLSHIWVYLINLFLFHRSAILFDLFCFPFMFILRFTFCLWIVSIAHTRRRARAEKVAPYNLVAPKLYGCVYGFLLAQMRSKSRIARIHIADTLFSHTDTDKRARRLCHFL